jgi:hypothetical protein
MTGIEAARILLSFSDFFFLFEFLVDGKEILRRLTLVSVDDCKERGKRMCGGCCL